MDSNGHLQRLRLLSYNIQAGIDTQRYRQYVTQSWKQVLPHRDRLSNLNRIASVVHGYDVVGLQEVDSGSLRSGFVDQTEYLAHQAAFPFWYKQVNRSLGKIAQNSNGLLSRLRPSQITEHKLPGLPGRGVIVSSFGGDDGITVCIMHLALGRRARLRQVAFIRELVTDLPHVVVMGDLNFGCDSQEMRLLTQGGALWQPSCQMNTFPSWRPIRKIDHILVSDTLQVENAKVVEYPLSDHLPIGIDVIIPSGVRLAA
ncbi:endonuclease/exonuclease/phosphatase family protein [Sedimenticola selenatireducens]|jgi:endonuclease/exonuclease/phosphatase family metal-dependent hydrolase|uniref:endonuclease/exonuclease/phosphatase family protein n=1 Tax=Sedimenticola selenatireducens TaxID=191960 RepID=UPI0021B17299|nr:endonuclease/exonuclease/phosphatase family protein [Sedimenticola selenatireducens]